MPALHSAQVPRYWFPAKHYGWGWGWPSTWHGWLVYAFYFSAFITLMLTISLVDHPSSFAMLAPVVLSISFVVVCWWKGEPPRWRWGK